MHNKHLTMNRSIFSSLSRTVPGDRRPSIAPGPDLKNVVDGKEALQHIVVVDDRTVGYLVIEKLDRDIHNHQPVSRDLVEHTDTHVKRDNRIQTVSGPVGRGLLFWHTKIIVR